MNSLPNTHQDISPIHPKRAQAVTFVEGEWRAVVCGVLQRPTFNAKGPALIFAQQVVTGIRKSEDVDVKVKFVSVV